MNTRRKRKARKTKRGGVGELYMMAGAITLLNLVISMPVFSGSFQCPEKEKPTDLGF